MILDVADVTQHIIQTPFVFLSCLVYVQVHPFPEVSGRRGRVYTFDLNDSVLDGFVGEPTNIVPIFE